MFKKILALSCLFCGSCLFSSEDTFGLPFYKETEHFQAYCVEQDYAAAETLLQDLEQFWGKWSEDLFPVSCLNKVKLNIYPDIQSYHSTIFGNSSHPDWLVCTRQGNSLSIVSPQNPGPIHSEESVMKCGRLCLGWFLTSQKYDTLPFWLSAGLSYCEVKIYTKEQVYQYLLNKRNEIDIAPPFLLEEPRQVAKRADLVASYVLTEFLIDRWGLEKAFAVLNDYSSFETILGVSKEEFRRECVQYVLSKGR
jgi:hypothetical protein